MFLSAIEKTKEALAQPEMQVLGAIVLVALYVSLIVYYRYCKRLAVQGPQTRPDLLGTPEMIAGAALMAMFALTIVGRAFGEGASAASEQSLEHLLKNNLVAMVLPPLAIVVLLLARGGSPLNVYGLRKVGLFRALALGVCLAVLAMPLTYGARAITVYVTSSQEAPQMLVQKFTNAVDGGDFQLIGLVALSACVVAPLTEEVLFRGTFYPMLARGFGRFPAALACALFFGMVHDTVTDIPGLTVLALCFTLAYEVTGSLLVPIFMHMSFNALSLLVMWWQVSAGVMP